MTGILIFNQKGGVAKSTSVVNIAGCLSECFNKKVLVIDCDTQATASDYLTLNEKREIGLYDYLTGEKSADEVIRRISIMRRGKKQDTKIWLAPADERLNEIELGMEDKDVFVKMVSELSLKPDYIIYDCPGYLNTYTVAAMCQSDHILVPAFADMDSLKGFGRIMDTVNDIRNTGFNENLEILGVFLTCVDRTSVAKQIQTLYKDEFNELLFDTTIRRTASVVEARCVGSPLIYYKEKSQVADDYLKLTSEIIKKTRAKRGKK